MSNVINGSNRVSLGEERAAITLQDVARAIQMSESTVSLALRGKGRLSPETRERVRKAARELGFQPNPAAQRLAIGHRDDVVALFAIDFDLGVGTRKLQILQRLFSERGFSTPVYVYGEALHRDTVDQAALVRNLRLLRPRAVVCNALGLSPSAFEELKHYIEEGGTVCSYDIPIDLACDQVVFDRENNTYQAMRHLLEQGHRHIGFYVGSTSGRSQYGWERLHGLKRALEEYDAPLIDGWLEQSELEHGGDRYEGAGARLGDYFLAQAQRPTAMCIVNEHVAMGFMARVQRAGVRIPHDVSIVSHDDLPVARFGNVVQLTTMSQPLEVIAQRTAEMLLQRLDGEYKGPPRTTTVHGELIVRESTTPPPA